MNLSLTVLASCRLLQWWEPIWVYYIMMKRREKSFCPSSLMPSGAFSWADLGSVLGLLLSWIHPIIFWWSSLKFVWRLFLGFYSVCIWAVHGDKEKLDSYACKEEKHHTGHHTAVLQASQMLLLFSSQLLSLSFFMKCFYGTVSDRSNSVFFTFWSAVRLIWTRILPSTSTSQHCCCRTTRVMRRRRPEITTPMMTSGATNNKEVMTCWSVPYRLFLSSARPETLWSV